MTRIHRVQPISAAYLLWKTGLTAQTHELIADFPHYISSDYYRLMCL